MMVMCRIEGRKSVPVSPTFVMYNNFDGSLKALILASRCRRDQKDWSRNKQPPTAMGDIGVIVIGAARSETRISLRSVVALVWPGHH